MNTEILRAIANATAASSVMYVSQAEGLPLLQNNPPLIAVDANQRDPNDPNKVAAQVTEAGVHYLNDQTGHTQNKPVAAFSVQSGEGFVLPKVTRGGGGGHGAPTKYPFDTMQVGNIFFVANTDVAKGDATKTLSSAVGAANQRYMEETGEHKTVTRAKRGEDRKAIKGPDGKNVTETVTIPVKKSTRKFTLRRVEGGKTYGSFVAPADGAVVLRTE